MTDQYRDASNLDARIQLHAHFSVNPYGWTHWVFDQLTLPPRCRILDVGCGPANLWLENLPRLPEGWDVVLSDFSAGMVRRAHQNLGHSHRPFRFAVVDAQAISFPNETFDVVIANHMLYHVPDGARALSEISRVLKPGGRLYASTIGKAHLREISTLIKRTDPELTFGLRDAAETYSFTLEDGMAQLSPWFSGIALHRYKDALKVTEVAPLIGYVLSGTKMTDDQRTRFTESVEQEMDSQGGAVHITKDSGIFEAFRRERD